MSVPTDTSRRKHYKRDRKKPFLEAFRKSGTISEASRATRIDRATVLRWRNEDADFAASFDEVNSEVTDELEQCAIKRAKNGSDVLLIFLLKNRAPEKYGDQKHIGACEEVARIMSSRIVDVVRRTVPDHCPSCKTHLDATRKVAEEMEQTGIEM